MFASNFLQADKYIKDAKSGEPLPEQQLNRCGKVIYAISLVVFLTVLICYLTLDTFKTSITAIVSSPIEGQNCTLLSGYNGSPLQSNSAGLSTLTSSLGTDEEFALSFCLNGGSGAVGNPYEVTSVVTDSLKTFTCTPDTTTTITDDFLIVNTPTQFLGTQRTFEQCIKSYSSALNIPLLLKIGKILKGNFGQQGTFSGKKMEKTSPINSYGATYYFSTVAAPTINIINQYSNAYYQTKAKCLSELKMVSADLVVTPQTVILKGSGIEFDTGVVFAYTDSYYGSVESVYKCVVPIQTAQIDFKLSNPDIKLSFGPSTDTDLYYTNVVCSNPVANPNFPDKPPNPLPLITAGRCGLNSNADFSSYDAALTMETFNTNFPNWVAEVCAVYEELPPYQCTALISANFVQAAGSALAFLNSILALLFAVGGYLLTQGYDVTKYFYGRGIKARFRGQPRSDPSTDQSVKDDKHTPEVSAHSHVQSEQTGVEVVKKTGTDNPILFAL